MSGPANDSSQGFHDAGKFQKTLWGQVFAAGKRDLPDSQDAMARLYQVYWPPIYSFLRRSGYARHKAQDLAQDFFGYLWEENLMAKADPDRGKFRNFLVCVLKRYVGREHKHQKTLKGGAGCKIVSIDAETDGFYANEPMTDETPEKIFDRHWSLKVLQQARERLRGEFARANRAEVFDAVEPFLTGENEDRFAALAQRLGKAEGAARTMVSRLRSRHRELILDVIAETLANREDAEKEFEYLVAAFRKS